MARAYCVEVDRAVDSHGGVIRNRTDHDNEQHGSIAMIFRETYRGAGPFAKMAEFCNLVARLFNNMTVIGDGYFAVSKQGVTLYLGAGGRYRQSWDLEMTNATTAKIYTGDLDLGDLGSIAASHAGLALTGATAWIYVERLTGASTATIKFSSTKPQSNSSGLRKRLYLLESSDGGTSYTITRDVRGDADYGSLIQ